MDLSRARVLDRLPLPPHLSGLSDSGNVIQIDTPLRSFILKVGLALPIRAQRILCSSPAPSRPSHPSPPSPPPSCYAFDYPRFPIPHTAAVAPLSPQPLTELPSISLLAQPFSFQPSASEASAFQPSPCHPLNPLPCIPPFQHSPPLLLHYSALSRPHRPSMVPRRGTGLATLRQRRYSPSTSPSTSSQVLTLIPTRVSWVTVTLLLTPHLSPSPSSQRLPVPYYSCL